MRLSLFVFSLMLISGFATSGTMEILVEYNNGRVDIVSYSFSDIQKFTESKGEHTISVLNDNNEEIYSTSFDIPLLIDIPPDPITGESFQIKVDRGAALIRIPYFPDGNYLKISDRIIPIHIIPYSNPLPAQPTEVIYGNCTGNGCFDLIFVADGFSSNMTQFKTDAQTIANFFGTIEPYKSNLNKLRITRVDNTISLGCYNNCNGIQRLICCDSNKVFSAVSGISYDEILVITNMNEYGGSGIVDGSDCTETSSYAVTFRDTSYYAKEVTVHETGHSFGGLWDEYEYGTSGSGDGPNCVHDSTCANWKGTQGTGCYAGCSYNGMYRPTDNSCLMRTLTPTGGYKFCPVCQNRILNKLSTCFSSSCTPNCTGKECGDDGCGGSCGGCSNTPADYCVDLQTLRDYSPYGTCSNYKCNYQYTDKKCPYICEQNRCVSQPMDAGIDITTHDVIETKDTTVIKDIKTSDTTSGYDIMIINNDTFLTDTLSDIDNTGYDNEISGCSCNLIE